MAAANPRLTLFRMKSTRFRKSSENSSDVSVEALSMTTISALWVVAKSELTHARSRFPEFQLMTAIVVFILFDGCALLMASPYFRLRATALALRGGLAFAQVFL